MIYETNNPHFRIVVARQKSGIGGRDLWLGAVEDIATGHVVQIETTNPGLNGEPATLTTIPAYRFGSIDRLDQLVETLRGLTPQAVAA